MENLREQFTRCMMDYVAYDMIYDFAQTIWWYDSRRGNTSLRLSENGFEIYKSFNKPYKIEIKNVSQLANISMTTPAKSLINLSRNMNSPYYICAISERQDQIFTSVIKNYIYVFSELHATWLKLVDGDIEAFSEQL